VIVAVDLDGTLDIYPQELRAIMSAVRAAGDTVIVISGSHKGFVDQGEVDGKAQMLASLGLDRCYDELVVIPGPETDVADRKAAYLQSIQASVLIDNRKKNCRAATKAGMLALCPWGSRE
jgi:hypothetical protein